MIVIKCNAAELDAPDAPFADVVQFGFGNKHGCLRREAGTVWCWGQKNFGELGPGEGSTDPIGGDRSGAPEQGCR